MMSKAVWGKDPLENLWTRIIGMEVAEPKGIYKGAISSEIRYKHVQIPVEWFWKEHRAPRQLELIEQGKEPTIPTFIEILLRFYVPNWEDWKMSKLKGMV